MNEDRVSIFYRDERLKNEYIVMNETEKLIYWDERMMYRDERD